MLMSCCSFFSAKSILPSVLSSNNEATIDSAQLIWWLKIPGKKKMATYSLSRPLTPGSSVPLEKPSTWFVLSWLTLNRFQRAFVKALENSRLIRLLLIIQTKRGRQLSFLLQFTKDQHLWMKKKKRFGNSTSVRRPLVCLLGRCNGCFSVSLCLCCHPGPAGNFLATSSPHVWIASKGWPLQMEIFHALLVLPCNTDMLYDLTNPQPHKQALTKAFPNHLRASFASQIWAFEANHCKCSSNRSGCGLVIAFPMLLLLAPSLIATPQIEYWPLPALLMNGWKRKQLNYLGDFAGSGEPSLSIAALLFTVPKVVSGVRFNLSYCSE